MAETRPNNPNVARVTYQMKRGTRVFENTFHLYRSAGWTLANLVSSLNAARDLWTASMKPGVPNDVALYNVHGIVYDPTGSPWVADVPVVPNVVGTFGSTGIASNASLAVSERASLAGRAYRGRIYWPGVPSTAYFTDDTVTSAFTAAIVNFAVAWLAAFGSPTGNGQLVIFHRNDNLFSTVASIVIESIVDAMRRRLTGRGI
jgi:hypothetical protein